jgi:predicted HTH domain antitoxin
VIPRLKKIDARFAHLKECHWGIAGPGVSGIMREEHLMMDSTMLDLGEDLSGFLATLGQPIERTAREMIVIELYRRSLVSSGKAAELLGIPRLEFIQRTSELGIPYFRFTEDEWQAEVAESKRA